LHPNFGESIMLSIGILYEMARLFFLTDWSYREIAVYIGASHQSVSRHIANLILLDIKWLQIQKMSHYEFSELLNKKKEEKKETEGEANAITNGKIHGPYERIARDKVRNKGRKGHPTIQQNFKEHLKQFGVDSVGESTFYNGVREAFHFIKCTMTQTYTPGRNLHADYAGKQLYIGRNKEMCFSAIVGVLPFSNFLFVKLTAYQKQEDWMGFIQETFVLIGGKPLFIITDNAAPLVAKAKPNLKLTDTYGDFCRHWDVVATPIPPASPNYNQPAEQGVKIFTTEIYPKLAAMELNTVEEATKELNKLVDEINARPLSGRKESRLELFEKYEKPALSPIKQKLFTFPIMRRQFTVDTHYRYRFDEIYYSVPWDLHGQKLNIEIYANKLVFKLKGKEIWIHERRREGSGHAMLLEHMPPNHKALLEQDKSYFLAWAKAQDETLVQLVEAQYKGLPDFDYYARENCIKIQKLLKKCCKSGKGGEFITACAMCIDVGRPNLKSINTLLHDDAVNNDEVMDAFEAYMASRVNSKGVNNHVH
jgi:hypothetical protein